MKWPPIMIFLLAGLTAAESLRPLDGGWSDQVWVCRDPLCQLWNICSINLNITYPWANTTYYDSNQDINVTVSGGTGNLTCYYRIDSNDWNLCPCDNPLCGRITTFPDGDVTVTVRANDTSGCYGEDSLTFTMRAFHNPANTGDLDDLIPLLIVAIIIFLDDDERRKTTPPPSPNG